MFVIKEKYRPFSHQPGFCCLVPGSTLEVEVFPALVRIYDLQGTERLLIEEIDIPMEGPWEQFTVFQDLEKGCVSVMSEKLHYHILPDGQLLFKKKAPALLPAKTERLFLGMHKKMQWEEIKARGDFQEIFPLWLQNAALLPPLSGKKGSSSLLEEVVQKIQKNRPEHILEAFRKFFLVAFRGMLVPRWEDSEYQGIPYKILEGSTPLHLLQEGAAAIRSLFFQEGEEKIKILPHVPPEFHSGTFTHLQLDQGILDVQWSKKTVRQVRIKTQEDKKLFLEFSPELASCRLRTRGQERGSTFTWGKGPLFLKAGETYLLDNFKK